MEFPEVNKIEYYVDTLHSEAKFSTKVVSESTKEQPKILTTNTIKLRANNAYLQLLTSEDKRIGTCIYLIIEGTSTSNNKPFKFQSRLAKIEERTLRKEKVNQLCFRSAGGSVLNAVYNPLVDMFKSITREVTFILKSQLIELDKGNTANYQSYNEEGTSLIDGYFNFEFEEGTNNLKTLITPDGTFFKKEERLEADLYLLSSFGWKDEYINDKNRKIQIPFSNYYEVIQQEETIK